MGGNISLLLHSLGRAKQRGPLGSDTYYYAIRFCCAMNTSFSVLRKGCLYWSMYLVRKSLAPCPPLCLHRYRYTQYSHHSNPENHVGRGVLLLLLFLFLALVFLFFFWGGSWCFCCWGPVWQHLYLIVSKSWSCVCVSLCVCVSKSSSCVCVSLCVCLRVGHVCVCFFVCVSKSWSCVCVP